VCGMHGGVAEDGRTRIVLSGQVVGFTVTSVYRLAVTARSRCLIVAARAEITRLGDRAGGHG
jgi:hypothetical protein